MKLSPDLKAALGAYWRENASLGGRTRAAKLSPEQRSEIARIAGSAPKRKRRKNGA